MFDFTHIVDFIFKSKNEYAKLSDEDKEKNFFIVNRKFARSYPTHAQFFNKKGMDKASAMDIWYQFFIKMRTNGVPSWYWGPKKTPKEKPLISKDEKEFLKEFYVIKDKDVDFLVKYYPDDVLEEVKKYKKFEKG